MSFCRVPLYTRKRNNGGLPMFLKNNFAGNARENLLKTLVIHEIMTDHEVEECLRYYFKLFLWLTGLGTKHRKYVDTGSGEEALGLWDWHCIAHCIEGWQVRPVQCWDHVTWADITPWHIVWLTGMGLSDPPQSSVQSEGSVLRRNLLQ